LEEKINQRNQELQEKIWRAGKGSKKLRLGKRVEND